MNGGIGSLDLINLEKLDSEEHQHIDESKNAGQHLLTVINEILLFSELEDDRTTYQKNPLDLVNICLEILEIVRPLCQQKNIELNLDYSPVISGGWLEDR